MSVTELKSKPSRKALLAAAQSMSARELNRLWIDLTELRARRVRLYPGKTERELLARVRKQFPEDLKREMQKLVRKLEGQLLTEKASERLREITFRREEWHAKRMQALVDLANLRRMTLDELLSELGIELPEDA